jgi:hypothetical protein
MTFRERAALDNHITGHYGEDQFADAGDYDNNDEQPEPECECVRIDVDLDDASMCPLHGRQRSFEF